MSGKAKQVTKHTGMGALPSAQGVSFRVWAPHAEKVYLTATFNDWNETATPLCSEKNGYWSADVPEAKAGHEYRYLVHGPNCLISRIDPYARMVTTR